MRELILGGARSGKSRYAEQQAEACDAEVIYVATAEVGDEEMRERIALHQQQRPADWRLVEEPITLAAVLEGESAPERCLIIDCLTLWLSNLLLADEAQPGLFERERAALVDCLPAVEGRIFLVSNEVGLGIVPDNALARRFRDEAGRLNQALAALCERVTLVTAGIPMKLKDV